jgi:hypothetical protein
MCERASGIERGLRTTLIIVKIIILPIKDGGRTTLATGRIIETRTLLTRIEIGKRKDNGGFTRSYCEEVKHRRLQTERRHALQSATH